TLRARVAVPVPGAAEVAALLDDANVRNPDLAQSRARQQPTEPAADDGDLHVVRERRAGEARLDVGVVHEATQVARDFEVLVVAIGAQTPVPLRAPMATTSTSK